MGIEGDNLYMFLVLVGLKFVCYLSLKVETKMKAYCRLVLKVI